MNYESLFGTLVSYYFPNQTQNGEGQIFSWTPLLRPQTPWVHSFFMLQAEVLWNLVGAIKISEPAKNVL